MRTHIIEFRFGAIAKKTASTLALMQPHTFKKTSLAENHQVLTLL